VCVCENVLKDFKKHFQFDKNKTKEKPKNYKPIDFQNNENHSTLFTLFQKKNKTSN